MYSEGGGEMQHHIRFFHMKHPSDAWVISEREETGLYPDDWIDTLRTQEAWTSCPWWLDYPEGDFPPNEAQHWASKCILDIVVSFYMV